MSSETERKAAQSGESGAAPSIESWMVDSLRPSSELSPDSLEALSTCLAEADAGGFGVIPWGGGSQMGLGNLPAGYDAALDLGGLSSVVEYEPNDVTISVEAGMTFAELARVIGPHSQMLPVDVADPEKATIGGLVAAGISGPRRFGYPSLRDLIIGITAVLPNGQIAKGGGRVVKNVSGFDMMRLYHGSLGSLAVIASVNFKLIPDPGSDRTVWTTFDQLEDADAAAEAVRLSQLAPTAIVGLNRAGAETAGVPAGAWTLLLRCESQPSAVERQADRVLAAVAERASDAGSLDSDASRMTWHNVAQHLSAAPSMSVWRGRLGSLPSAAADIAARIDDVPGVSSRELQVAVDFGNGMVYVSGPVERIKAELFRSIWSRISEPASHATLLTVPPEWKQGIDVFGRRPAGWEVMHELKQQFDPNGTLNRGRFVGFL